MPVRTTLRRHPFALTLACVAAAAAVLVSEAAYWRSVNKLAQLSTIHSARAGIWSLQQGLLSVESAQRGYLITRRDEYLEPYQGSVRQVNDSLATLDRFAREVRGEFGQGLRC